MEQNKNKNSQQPTANNNVWKQIEPFFLVKEQGFVDGFVQRLELWKGFRLKGEGFQRILEDTH